MGGRQKHLYNDEEEDIDDLFNSRFGKGKSKKDKKKEKKDKKAEKKKEKEETQRTKTIRRKSTKSELPPGVQLDDKDDQKKREEEEAERKRKQIEEAEKERKRKEEETKKQEILRYYSQKPVKDIITVQKYVRRHLAKKRVRFYSNVSPSSPNL